MAIVSGDDDNDDDDGEDDDDFGNARKKSLRANGSSDPTMLA